MATAPACKSDVENNFAQASARDSLVYGSARPGGKGQRCFDANDKVTEQEVLEWATFMKERGIQRVVGLLSSSEQETYVRPPAQVLNEAGLATVNVDVEKEAVGGTKAVLQLIGDATQAQEKVVVHCWGGGGRAGRFLAAYLATQYGLTPEEAAEEVTSFAKSQGASRRVDVASLKAALGG